MAGVQPSVSVVIPAHNEQEFITRCIASVRETGWPVERLDIVVVDNGSTDDTASLAARAGGRVVRYDGGTIGAVRNAGLRAARGDYVAYVDGDCTVATTWLRYAMEHFQANDRIGAVGGPCLSPSDGTWVERSLASCRLSRQGLREVQSLATSSFIASRKLLHEAGLFNETLLSGEDDDMSRKIRQRGLVLLSVPECHVVHYGYPRTWWSMVKKQIWHGSNQLETSTGVDLTLLLTHLFLISWLATLPLLVAAATGPTSATVSALIIAALMGCLPPFFYALKKLKANARDSAQLPRWIAVGFAYFSGRSLGLAQNYLRLIGRKPASTGR
jgi:cellulose synthase/poly-beta-1,6-N-acetylglucosamine synthase-like glycosyltransferase